MLLFSYLIRINMFNDDINVMIPLVYIITSVTSLNCN
jgi:hypothetical protein